MAESPRIEEARKQALDVLYDCITPHGFRASALKEGYPQIWSRDSMIVSLGAVTIGDSQLLEACRASLSPPPTRVCGWLACVGLLTSPWLV